MKSFGLVSIFIVLSLGGLFLAKKVVGKQPDGSFVVSTGQKVLPGTIAFAGRPMELAVRPGTAAFAVATNREVFLCENSTLFESSRQKLESGVSYRGMAWSPDGSRLWISLSNGKVARFHLENGKLNPLASVKIVDGAPRKDAVPGGMCWSSDGSKVFLVDANAGEVLEVDSDSGAIIKRVKVGNIPFECRLSEDGKTLVVSNWGGREATAKEIEEGETDTSDGVTVLVDKRGTSKPGTVTVHNLETGVSRDVQVGVHPCGLAIVGQTAWVANAGSDTVSEIDLASVKVNRTIRVAWNNKMLFGSMPNSLAVVGRTLLLCNGGDNAICEIEIDSGKVLGFRPAGYFPVAVQTTADGSKAFVCNTKGNGSVANTAVGKPGGVHDFQGTVSVIDRTTNLAQSTAKVVELNDWNRKDILKNPDLAVYKGKIKHVLYIIKENKTYDSVFGDMEKGNGDKSLCQFPEEVTPNIHKLAREYTLFDNAYVVGTNSAEGHQWALEGLANDYIERFYGGYSRSYPFDGDDPMAYSSGGFIWDPILDAGKKVRNYGEFCGNAYIDVQPARTKWIDAWRDRETKSGKVTVKSTIGVKRMKPFTHPSYPCWPMTLSDQYRADTFIMEFEEMSKADKVPDFMLMILPNDHAAGTNPDYPTPRAMVADNDLALGRIVEAVSKSPQWKDTAVIVMQDDAQGGLDHVDGHRTVLLAICPYTKRGHVDSSFYTQISVIRTISAMLGTRPLTRFDATASPLADCFQNAPTFVPYKAVPNRIPLDEMNKPAKETRGMERFWAQKSMDLDLSDVDSANWYWLNRIHWAATKGWNTPYPQP